MQKFISCTTQAAPNQRPIISSIEVGCPQENCDGAIELPYIVTMLDSPGPGWGVYPICKEADYAEGERLYQCQGLCQQCGTVVSLTLEVANYVLREIVARYKSEKGLTWVGKQETRLEDARARA